MVGAGRGADCSGLECLTLGFGMRRPGTHIPRTYRVHPDQKQLFGLRQGLEVAGAVDGVAWALAPGNEQSVLLLSQGCFNKLPMGSAIPTHINI